MNVRSLIKYGLLYLIVVAFMAFQDKVREVSVNGQNETLFSLAVKAKTLFHNGILN